MPGALNVWEALEVGLARGLLLVLDNLEQVLGCAPFVAQLLAGAASVKILGTSREPLRLRGERQIGLDPLALPAPHRAGELPEPADAVSTYEAVRLFVDRAVAVRRDFAVTNDTAPAVAAICARLDGLPLAIELAAARLKVLSPDGLLRRLDTALGVLTGGSRDAPARQQTLRATLAWSYELLSDPERQLLARLSALPAASISYEMVEGVCGDGVDVLELLGHLVDKNLVRADDTDGEVRYRLLVSVRDFACEQCDAHLAADLRAGHARWVLEEVAKNDPYDDAGYSRLHAYVGAELAHVRAALREFHEAGPPRRLAELVAALYDTLVHRGLLSEVVETAQQALASLYETRVPVAPELEANLLDAIIFAKHYLLLPSTPQQIQRLLTTARQCPEPAMRADFLAGVLGAAATDDESQLRELLAEYEEARRAIKAPPEWMERERHRRVAFAFRFVDPPMAEQAARALRPFDQMTGPVCLADVLLDRGEWREARQVLEDASDTAHNGSPNPRWASTIARAQARAATAAGEFEEAHGYVEVCRRRAISAGIPPLEATTELLDLLRGT